MDDSDGSDMVTEVLCNHVYRLFTIIRCGPWLSGVRSILSVSPASRPPRCCGLNFPSSDTNMVNFHIEYVDNCTTSVESLILYKINAPCNSSK